MGWREQSITYEWLKANGFHLLARLERQPTDHVCRWVAGEKVGGGLPFESSDDLGIELCHSPERSPSESFWYCWVVHAEGRRSIHVRHMKQCGDVARLWEGLTGRDWPEGK